MVTHISTLEHEDRVLHPNAINLAHFRSTNIKFLDVIYIIVYII